MLSRLLLALLCSTATSAFAKLTNHTIDDTSPSVVYNGPVILHCVPGTCTPGWTNQTFNTTSTITSSSITVSFTGSAVYVFLDATSDVFFTLDNSQDVAFWTPPPPPNGTMHLAYHSASLPATSHVLVIAPSTDGVIDLDYILYTVDVKPTPIGAIVGGVLGALAALLALVALVAFLLRRRNLRLKERSSRAGWKANLVFVRGGGGEVQDDKSSVIRLVGMQGEKVAA
ncbi:hypothetical protein C8R45DRAFT_85803 [Mycena sanguinolenta]|nr:hypothetical protein C8R45DRAFT_85803 [Mycena sanguinolenta]